MLSEYAVNLKKTIVRSREGHEDSKKSSVLSDYRLFQVLYVKFVLGSLHSPSYNLRRQINRPFQVFYVKFFFSSLRSPSYSFEQQINRPNRPFQVLYVKFYFGSIRSPSYNFRRQIHRPNCTISSLVCPIFSTRYAHPHSLKLQIKQPNCTISSLVCPIFLWLATLALTILNKKYIFQIAPFQALCVTFVSPRPQIKLSNFSHVIATIDKHMLLSDNKHTHAHMPIHPNARNTKQFFRSLRSPSEHLQQQFH
jgi:hypothetical protein